MSSLVWLDLAPAHAVASASLTLEVPAAKATVPVDGPPLTLRWGPSAEPFDARVIRRIASCSCSSVGSTP